MVARINHKLIANNVGKFTYMTKSILEVLVLLLICSFVYFVGYDAYDKLVSMRQMPAL